MGTANSCSDVCARSGPDRLDPALSGRPLWLLDIDGVVNAWRYRKVQPAKPDLYNDLVEHLVPTCDGRTFTFWVSPTLLGDLRDLHASGLVEIAWLTTWEHQANSHVAATLNLPAFPVYATKALTGGWGWKTTAAVEAARTGRPLIWTDDDAITPTGRRELKTITGDLLLIAPEPSQGLTPGHLDTIRELISTDPA